MSLFLCIYKNYSWLFFSKATNLSSNSTLIGESQEPEENKVRSMAKQLLAKFENKPNYTLRRTQV